MNNATVYTGVWQNHSQLGWKGSTLTLEKRAASLLISSLATFITLVGTRFWSIVSFSIHQIRASPEKKDGIHHQHQVIYRNGSSALGTAWTTLQISWAWRNRARNNLIRSVATILPPLIVFAGFAAASVLSAKVVASGTAANQVKLMSRNCGYLDPTSTTNAIGDLNQSNAKTSARWSISTALKARSYARSCYDDNSSENLASCNLYTVSRLPYAVDDEAPCPFGGHRCILGDNKALMLQTPWLNSHEDFGINAPPSERVEWRRTTTCSVLNVTDRISTQSSSSGTNYLWHLGYAGSLQSRTNITYQYNDNIANLGIGYTIRPDFCADQDRYPGWIPIPDLSHTDADVSALYLAQNSVFYPDPVDDPLYSAHRKFPNPLTGYTYYASDSLTSVVGCIDQSQIRNPITKNATPPLGFQRLLVESYNIGLNPAQQAASLRFIVPSESIMMFNSVNGLGATALKAQDSLFITISSGLPSNQWQIEVRGWFDTALAGMQSSILNFASKDITELATFGNISLEADAEHTKPMCDNQMIRAVGDYQSFSMMGIEIIVAVGLFIALLSLALEYVVGFFHARSKSKAYKKVLWTSDNVLQQQRLAFEHGKVDGWEETDGNVPVTKLGRSWKSEPLTA